MQATTRLALLTRPRAEDVALLVAIADERVAGRRGGTQGVAGGHSGLRGLGGGPRRALDAGSATEVNEAEPFLNRPGQF
jgi:hypothetical protein